MEVGIIIALLIGTILGFAVSSYYVHKFLQQKLLKKYGSELEVLKQEHQKALKEAKNRSIDGSRAVIKGKIAEQLAPVLPDFNYLPSDARFIGDPVDYIIFNGYTELKDNGGSESDLEVVILDVKTGQQSLSQLQKAIARAIGAGRVRFEVARPEIPQGQPLKKTNPSRQDSPPKAYSLEDIRKTHSRAYKYWSKQEDEQLKTRYQQGATIEDLVREFKRKPGGIRSRLKKLGLRQ